MSYKNFQSLLLSRLKVFLPEEQEELSKNEILKNKLFSQVQKKLKIVPIENKKKKKKKQTYSDDDTLHVYAGLNAADFHLYQRGLEYSTVRYACHIKTVPLFTATDVECIKCIIFHNSEYITEDDLNKIDVQIWGNLEHVEFLKSAFWDVQHSTIKVSYIDYLINQHISTFAEHLFITENPLTLSFLKSESYTPCENGLISFVFKPSTKDELLIVDETYRGQRFTKEVNFSKLTMPGFYEPALSMYTMILKNRPKLDEYGYRFNTVAFLVGGPEIDVEFDLAVVKYKYILKKYIETEFARDKKNLYLSDDVYYKSHLTISGDTMFYTDKLLKKRFGPNKYYEAEYLHLPLYRSNVLNSTTVQRCKCCNKLSCSKVIVKTSFSGVKKNKHMTDITGKSFKLMSSIALASGENRINPNTTFIGTLNNVEVSLTPEVLDIKKEDYKKAFHTQFFLADIAPPYQQRFPYVILFTPSGFTSKTHPETFNKQVHLAKELMIFGGLHISF